MRTRLGLLGAMLAALALVIAGVGTERVAPVAAEGSSVVHDIDVDDNFFDPQTLTDIEPGDTIRWTWVGSALHTVTAYEGATFDSGPRASGTFEQTFPGGTVLYHCEFHGFPNATCIGQCGALIEAEPDPSPSPDPDPDPDPDPEPGPAERVSGPDRFETAIAASQSSFRDWDDADGDLPVAQVVVLSRSDEFADALAGTALAVAEGGPLLLTRSGSLHPATREEIERILASGSTVYLLGGPVAISEAVADELKDLGYVVVRLAGDNRFETAIEVADQVTGGGAPARILVTTGINFPDALAAGAVAVEVGGVVVLTRGDVMPTETGDYIAEHAGVPRSAIGGPAAAADPDADPVVGANRFETATMAAEEFFDGPTVVGVASGENFPDALSGGAHIGMRGGPLVLVRSTQLPADTRTYLEANASSIATAFIYGGPAAISEDVREAIEQAIS